MTYKMILKPLKEKSVRASSQDKAQPMPDSKVIPKTLGEKTAYVPPWYKGERGAYESAMRARKEIGNLPKMK